MPSKTNLRRVRSHLQAMVGDLRNGYDQDLNSAQHVYKVPEMEPPHFCTLSEEWFLQRYWMWFHAGARKWAKPEVIVSLSFSLSLSHRVRIVFRLSDLPYYHLTTSWLLGRPLRTRCPNNQRGCWHSQILIGSGLPPSINKGSQVALHITRSPRGISSVGVPVDSRTEHILMSCLVPSIES